MDPTCLSKFNKQNNPVLLNQTDAFREQPNSSVSSESGLLAFGASVSGEIEILDEESEVGFGKLPLAELKVEPTTLQVELGLSSDF